MKKGAVVYGLKQASGIIGLAVVRCCKKTPVPDASERIMVLQLG